MRKTVSENQQTVESFNQLYRKSLHDNIINKLNMNL